jgi:5-methylcytosine-specific restriction endonuclease McrA
MATWPYTTQRWQRLRRHKLRDKPLCELCLKIGRIEPAVAVDHLLAIKTGGEPYPPLYALMSLCVRCHNTKTPCGPERGADERSSRVERKSAT